MKKVALTIFALFAVASLWAQESSGNYFITGTFNFSVSSTSETSGSVTVNGPSRTTFKFNPKAGMFIEDNLAVGAGLGFVINSSKRTVGDTDFTTTQTIFGLNPFARYYEGNETVGFFIEGGLGLSFGGSKIKQGNTSVDGPNLLGFDIGVSPGLYYYLTPRLSLEATFGFFGYERLQYKDDNDNKETESFFGLTINPASFNFGLAFHF